VLLLSATGVGANELVEAQSTGEQAHVVNKPSPPQCSGETEHVVALNTGVSTFVLAHTTGESTHVVPHVIGESTHVPPEITSLTSSVDAALIAPSKALFPIEQKQLCAYSFSPNIFVLALITGEHI
jgi:hypothetical protein